MSLVTALVACAMAPWAACQAQTPVWTLRAQQPGTDDLAMAYDSSRNVTVCFSGYISSTKTFEWNGVSWSLRATSGPSLRYGHVMAYDAARKVTVLFGGADHGVENGETWTWNGSSWTRVATTGPSPREYSCMAYDSDRGVCVLFGGADGPDGSHLLGETWEWNGVSWSRRMGPEPEVRTDSVLAYDSARRTMVLYGGVTLFSPPDVTIASDLWELGAGGWVKRDATGPGPGSRAQHAMVYDSKRRVCLVNGGYSGGTLPNPDVADSTWAWDGSRWFQLGASAGAHAQHAMAYDSTRGVTVLQGGYTDIQTGSSATWELSWSCAADVNFDGFLTFEDFDAFVDSFQAGVPRADFNEDGFLTFEDFDGFVTAFESGC